jgi:hypothetical protein
MTTPKKISCFLQVPRERSGTSFFIGSEISYHSKVMAIGLAVMLHSCNVLGNCFKERLGVLLEIFEGIMLVAFAHLINIFWITVCIDFS